MSPKKLIHLLSIGSAIGLALIAVGFYIAFFTDVTVKYGITGLRADAEIIGLGFLLFAPTRMILTFKLMGIKVDDTDGEDGAGR